VEACGQAGCPVCRCVAAESRSHLAALLSEQVTDPQSRARVRGSWGFCNWHAWMLLEIESSRFGAAILYEDLMRIALRLGEGKGPPARWIAALRRRARRSPMVERYRTRAVCAACATAAEAERRYLHAVVRFVDDEELRAAYESSDGVCLPHLMRAVDAATDARRVETLLDRTRVRWASLRRDLAGFVAKHDHRSRAPFTAAEAESCERAFAILAGGRGVFGNDLSGPARGGRRRALTRSSARGEAPGR
jgi:hypothetical protein